MKFQVELKQDEFTRLRELAEAERRGWREQAAFILARVLKCEDKKPRADAQTAKGAQ